MARNLTAEEKWSLYRAIDESREKLCKWRNHATGWLLDSAAGNTIGQVMRTGFRETRGVSGGVQLYGARYDRIDMPRDGSEEEAMAWVEERARGNGWTIVTGAGAGAK